MKVSEHITDNDVIELTYEVSVEADFFQLFLEKDFQSCLYNELAENHYRYTYAYSNEGRYLNGFEKDLHHNFYTYETIQELITKFKSDAARYNNHGFETGYRSLMYLCELLDIMMREHPETNIISVIAP